jgi:hypothetical protein
MRTQMVVSNDFGQKKFVERYLNTFRTILKGLLR